jgi:short-subunit dehydrogenase
MGFYEGKSVFITGASSGIGEALARELSRQGAELALAARRVDRLETLARELSAGGRRAIAIACDVTRDGDCERAIEEARAKLGRVDVVVANAGFGVVGRVEKLTLEDFRRQLETNFFGLLRTTYASLAELKRQRGSLVLIGSVSSYVAPPETAPYGVSKYAVRAFAEALGHEIRPYGVRVTLICPGFVDSEIRQVDNRGVLKSADDPIPRWLRVPAPRAARAIARAVARGRREAVITGHGKAIVFLTRHFHWLVSWIIGAGVRGRREPA